MVVDLASDEIGQKSGSTRLVNLGRGSVLFAPTEDTTVHTRLGSIRLTKGSVVLVMVFGQGVAVYDLHDTKSGSVAFTTGEMRVPLTPGSVVVVSEGQKSGFDDINPARLIGYRDIRESLCSGNRKLYLGRFSVIHALSAVMPVPGLVASSNQNARNVAGRLVKTAAILTEVDTGDYQQVLRPERTALRN